MGFRVLGFLGLRGFRKFRVYRSLGLRVYRFCPEVTLFRLHFFVCFLLGRSGASSSSKPRIGER